MTTETNRSGVLFLLLIALILWCLVAFQKACAAQEIPDHPKPQPRVIDKRFLALSFASKASMATDFYFTHRNLQYGYAEHNPLLGRHPSDARLIGTGIAFAASLDLASYFLKRRHNRFWAIPEMLQTAQNVHYAWHNAQASTTLYTCTQYSTGERDCRKGDARE